MNASIQVAFVKQLIEINVNKISRIQSEWSELENIEIFLYLYFYAHTVQR